MPASAIQNPAGYVPEHAVAFSDVDGTAVTVSAAMPLPVSLSQAANAALSGTAATSGLVGPFQPVLGRPVVLALSGTWSGTVKVSRSTDGGATKLPLTVAGTVWGQYTGNCCEAVWDESEAAARLYLDIALSSGSVTYRLAQ
ncbi:MAG: hypothetical protein JF593_08445 [Novosphingobium sp.]|nr:hypothetical protein [Novosphingobium sp.]